MTSPEPWAPKATGLPRRSWTARYGLSARTTNMPGVEYIAATIFRFAGGRPIPLNASCATSPWTSAMSTAPASSSGTFSVLPLVLRCSIVSPGSVSSTVSATAAPYTGKPPPGVAVPRTTTVRSLAGPPAVVAMADTLSRPSRRGWRLADHPRFESKQTAIDLAELIGHLAAKAIELLIDADDAFAHELDLVHQTIPDDIEMAASLGRACGELGTELASGFGELDAQLVHDR